MKSSIAASAPPCSNGEWTSLKTPGSTEELILAREEGQALAMQVSRVTDTWTEGAGFIIISTQSMEEGFHSLLAATSGVDLSNLISVHRWSSFFLFFCQIIFWKCVRQSLHWVLDWVFFWTLTTFYLLLTFMQRNSWFETKFLKTWTFLMFNTVNIQ